MKHFPKVALLVLVVVCAANLSAQIALGIRGGLNLANWSFNDAAKEEAGGSPNSVNAVVFGALLEVRLSDNLAIQPEVNYIQKGGNLSLSAFDPTIGNVSLDFTQRINYLEVPLLLKVGTGFGLGRFDVLLGPSFGYGLNGKAKTTFTALGQTETETESIDFERDEISRTDLGAQIGASLGLNLGSSLRLFVDGRYLLGFTNLDKHEHGSGSGHSDDEPTIKNRGIALTAGLIFPF